jgi:hypothetical protein
MVTPEYQNFEGEEISNHDIFAYNLHKFVYIDIYDTDNNDRYDEIGYKWLLNHLFKNTRTANFNDDNTYTRQGWIRSLRSLDNYDEAMTLDEYNKKYRIKNHELSPDLIAQLYGTPDAS